MPVSVARLRRFAFLMSALETLVRSGLGPLRLRKLSLVSFLRRPFSGLGSHSDGDEAGEDEDIKDGDRVIKSGPNTMLLPFWVNFVNALLDDAPALGNRCVRSNLFGFLRSGFGGAGAGRGESISRSSHALSGRPLAIAELAVC